MHCDVVAIGTSAGGLSALSEVLKPLAANFPPILIVQHLDPQHKSLLADLLSRKTAREVREATDHEPIRRGFIYIGPPNEHMVAEDGHIRLLHSAMVNFSRPSIDMLFQSVARLYGATAIGVVLSGSNRDGSEGIRCIKGAGGTTLAQAPETADFPVMPRAAIQTGQIDYVVALQDIGNRLTELCSEEQVKK